jgi:hypothetical protein
MTVRPNARPTVRLRALVAALGAASCIVCPLGCHVCDYTEVTTTAPLSVPEGVSCPAQDTAKGKLGSGVLEVLGPAQASPVSGFEDCCYEANVHEPMLDEVVQAAYDTFTRCDSVEACHCVDAPKLLGSPEAAQLLYVPEDVTLMDVRSGPTYEYFALCQYGVHVRRPAGVVSKHRCTRVTFPSGQAGTQHCPAQSTLVGSSSPLIGASDETIDSLASGPTLENAQTPTVKCDYPVTAKKTSDVCG